MIAGVKTPAGDVKFNLATLAGLFKMDEGNLTKTINILEVVFTAMNSLPRKPVIVIGRFVWKFWILFSPLLEKK